MGWLNRCKHLKIQVHSVQYWANTTNVIASCVCGKSLTFWLGYVADESQERTGKVGPNVIRVTKMHLEAKGYVQTNSSNIWIKES